eukprot:TRINITY_DN34_c2_g3_i7.p2 TRINITY_DN34_c2_g3~~TRINITY_DN34_c2_g3_i7.p2  ORF type:complete len:280 (-),score=142.76 TRINITY_DN34_c2_g3_i7:61-822(-)
MSTDFLGRPGRDFFRPATLLAGGDFSAKTQAHLVEVFRLLVLTSLSAFAGVWLNARFLGLGNGLMVQLAALGVVVWLQISRHTGFDDASQAPNYGARVGALCLFGALTGVSLGPLLALAGSVDPRIVPTALLGTASIFACFSLAAALGKRRSFLYLSGICSSMLAVLLVSRLVGMFSGGMGPMMLNLQIYGGLAMFMMYILVDVQVEIEASESGRRDAVSGALDLFVDAVAIFVRLVIILTRNKKEERRRDRN